MKNIEISLTIKQKSLFAVLTSSLNKKGYVTFDPKAVSNKLYKFVEKNSDSMMITTLDNGLAQIVLPSRLMELANLAK